MIGYGAVAALQLAQPGPLRGQRRVERELVGERAEPVVA